MHTDKLSHKSQTTSSRLRLRAADACQSLACALSALMGLTPDQALAAIDVSNTLTNVLNMLSNGVVLLGGILVVMGLVNLGMSLKDGTQGGGSQLSGALAMIVGGIVVSAAGAYFRTLDTNIAG